MNTIYGDAIQQAIISGDLHEMKKVAKDAEEHLRQTGDVRLALELLKLEITKLELRQTRKSP